MAKWICKISNHPTGQKRITLPKGLVESQNWKCVRYMVLDESPEGVILRRFVDGESLKGYDKDDSALSDR